MTDTFSTFVYERVKQYGGGKIDRAAAAALKPYGASIDFDGDNRAVRVYMSHQVYVKGIPQRPKPVNVAAIRNLRRLDRLQFLRLGDRKIDAACWAPLRDHPSLVRLEDQGALTDSAIDYVITMPTLRELMVIGHRLTDRGLERLLRAHQFTSLEISTGKLTAQGFAAFSTRLTWNT